MFSQIPLLTGGLPLVLVLAGVVVVIMDFDRPASGFIVVSQDRMVSLVEMMETN